MVQRWSHGRRLMDVWGQWTVHLTLLLPGHEKAPAARGH